MNNGKRVGILTLCSLLTLSPFTGCRSQGVPSDTPVVRLELFYSVDCTGCEEVVNVLLPSLERDFGPLLSIERISIDSTPGFMRLVAREKEYEHTGQGDVTINVVGNSLIVGTEEIMNNLRPIVGAILSEGSGAR